MKLIDNRVPGSFIFTYAYTYDKIGNRMESTGFTNATYIADKLNQYSQLSIECFPLHSSVMQDTVSGQTFETKPIHDLDGNLTGDGGNWSYTWNNDEVRQHEDGAPQACPKGCGERVPSGRFTQQNRLVSVTDGTTTVEFTYDYQGRLVKKDDGTDVEIYVYDGWNRIATFEVSPSTGSGQTFTLLSANVWGLDLSGSFQGAGGVGGLLKEGGLYPIYDANGNIMQKLNDSGIVVMSVDYDPFGNIISGTLTGEYGFSTKPLMDNLNWYYYGFRYYDPVTGRWPSRDPIGFAGGLNFMAFAANNAINLIDKLGLKNCFDQSSFDTCLSGVNDELADCIEAADIAKDSCLDAANDVGNVCRNSCDFYFTPGGVAHNTCIFGCNRVQNTGQGVCWTAYFGMASGCGYTATIATEKCALDAWYVVADGCPCDR